MSNISNTGKTLDLTLHIVDTEDGSYIGHFPDIPDSEQSATSIDGLKSTIGDTISKHLGIPKEAMSIVENLSISPDATLDKKGISLTGVTVTYTVSF